MTPDVKTIETLVEIITREVLLAMVEQEEKAANPSNAYCVVDVANGVKVRPVSIMPGMWSVPGRNASPPPLE
jgi:hypothetical protein